MPDKPDSLDGLFKRSPRRPAEEKIDTPEPEETDAISIADMNGTHSARPANRNLTRLHIVLKDGSVQSFQYAYLDARSTYDGKEFVLVFVGLKHFQITVKGNGPKFWSVYDYITTHRWPYLREATGHEGKFADRNETIFPEIAISDITPRETE